MKLPRHTASGPVRETGLVRAQDIGSLTNVGDAEFRAIEQAGRAIGAVSDMGVRALQSRQALDDTIESGKATQRVQESWNEAEESVDNFNPAHDLPLPGDPKYLETLTTFGTTERDAFLQSSLKDIEKDAKKIFSGISNPGTKARLEKQYNDFYAGRTVNLKDKLNKVLSDYQIDEMGKLARAAAVNGDMETSDFYVNMMADHGLITNVKATSLKASFNELSIRSQATELYRMGLYDEAREFIASSSLEVLDKEAFGNIIDTAENRAIAKTKVVDAEAIEAERQAIDGIFILPRGEFLDKAMDAIDLVNSSTILPVKDKEAQRAKINKRIDAISSGKIDPVTQFDPKTYDILSVRIARNSKAVNETDISGRVGLGERGGITTKQAEELTRLKKFYDGADVLGNSLHRTYTSAITGLKTAKRFSRNKTENIQFAAQARSVLDSWAVKNPDAKEEDYQAFFDRLIDNSRMNTWARGWFTRKAEEDRISIRENIEEIQKELAGESLKWEKGNTRIIGGITYTFNGKTWND